jgi:hypothetical protein
VLIALAGVIAFVLLVSPLLLCWHCYPCGIFPLVVLVSSLVFCTGINHPNHTGIFIVVLLALPPKAHIALVILPLFHWRHHHHCVVHTNVGTHVIVCIGTCSPLHLFTTVCDLVFKCGLDCNGMLELSWACVMMAALATPLSALLPATAPLLLPPSGSLYLASLPDTAFVALALFVAKHQR